MSRPPASHPTELELEILKIIWRDGPASVRQVRDALAGNRPLAYTSVMTIMTIMTRKKYLRRKKVDGAFTYSAIVAEQATLAGMLKDLIHRVFSGSTTAVMQNLLTNDLEPEELDRLKKLIDEKAKRPDRK
jgi:predicted transcriptional regulator